jgi:hypothetical protein
MRRILYIPLLLLLITIPLMAQDAPLQLVPGEATILGEILLYLSPVPLTTDIGTSFGRRGTNRAPNLSDKKTVTEQGLSIYDALIALKTSKGFPALRTVVVEVDRVTIEKFRWTDFEEVYDPIMGIFKVLEVEEE